MMKVLGAGMIFLASILTASAMIAEKRNRYRLLISLKESLFLLCNEIGERTAPLAESFAYLSNHGNCEATCRFYRRITGEMSALGEKLFSEIWQDSVSAELVLLSEQEKAVLLSIGQAFSGVDPEMLCGRLENAAHALDAQIEKMEKEKNDYLRLAFGLSLSIGVLTIIMLI